MRSPLNMAWVSWTLLLCLVVGCDAQVAPSPAPPPASPPATPAADTTTGPLIAFLGDSISAGLHVDESEAFPARLAALCRDRGQPFRLLNAGRSGDTTAGGLRRIDWILAQNPDVVVIELGGNDGLRGQPVAAIEKNLRGIVARVTQAGAKPLLLGMRIPSNYGAEYARDFSGLYARIAADLGTAYVPFFMEGVAGDPHLNQPDGIHPTAEGHQKIAQNLIEPMTALLTQLGPAEATAVK